jgi:hypothetical protein
MQKKSDVIIYGTYMKVMKYLVIKSTPPHEIPGFSINLSSTFAYDIEQIFDTIKNHTKNDVNFTNIYTKMQKKARDTTYELKFSTDECNCLNMIVQENWSKFNKAVDDYEETFVLSDQDKSFRNINKNLDKLTKIMEDEHARIVVQRSMAALVGEINDDKSN